MDLGHGIVEEPRVPEYEDDPRPSSTRYMDYLKGEIKRFRRLAITSGNTIWDNEANALSGRVWEVESRERLIAALERLKP